MKNVAGARADLRGFRWPLQALERKLDADLLRARALLTRQNADAAQLAARVQALEDGLAQEGRWLQDACARLFDPARRREALSYLAGVAQQIAEKARAAETARERAAVAAQECLRQERQLASVQELRACGQAAYAMGQLRREGREADLAWLTRSAAAKAG